MNERPRPGDLLIVDGAASVQFAGERALRLRVVSVGEAVPYSNWLWLTGYVIDRHGRATARREVYVQLAGLRRAASPPPAQIDRRAASPPPAQADRRPASPPPAQADRRPAGPPSTSSRSTDRPARSDGVRR
ncbi:hypothetical protein ACIG87_07250 [Micromonospora sp. NPDC051925]|uniref:hypothetical protein n=1 Tax=Micromonospora sp. NPDC051925 TaxID=3364288 RepID=UPI0037CB2301